MHNSLEFFESNLFHDVQMASLFSDSKTFADALPKKSYQEAMRVYEQAKNQDGFALNEFVNEHFALPCTISCPASNKQTRLFDYISHQWQALARPSDNDSCSSLIPLKYPYIVPGGRFREIYYWDSYFTSLGLATSGKINMVTSMMKNFIDIQERVGLIPNGNRTYYHTRTQPPVLALLLELLLQHDPSLHVDKNDPFFLSCLHAIEQEYQLWMDGRERLCDELPSYRRVVKVGDAYLNRYWDDSVSPRAESYREDVSLGADLPAAERDSFYRSIRAACESGWDFSARWLKDSKSLSSIHTTDIIPVDLNALLYKVECDLAQYYNALSLTEKAAKYTVKAKNRAVAIDTYLWQAEKRWYFDYDFVAKKSKTVYSLAACFPMLTGLSSQSQAKDLHSTLLKHFDKEGGLVTTTRESGQQWDAPNGWAPLNYVACRGLLNYGFTASANKIMQAWISTVNTQFIATGNIMEKYDVVNPHTKASGGEYDVQEGFGWTNGVTVAFDKLLEKME